jgi:ATPase family associated with various cellular activities (AAA)
MKKTILNQLGIYGWKEQDENLILSSLLTGDPLLMIGNHGCAKTHLAYKMAQALQKRFAAYDAGKSLFDDVLGYPDIEKLKQGEIAYISSKVTIFDKEMVLIDEINRCDASMQSKWLEIIRSRKIMGFPTDVKWVWAAMNPISYSATQQMDEALVGRFATFVYIRDVLEMEEADRIKVAETINGDDCLGMSEWLDHVDKEIKTVKMESTLDAGVKIIALLKKAAVHFKTLKRNMGTLSEFLAKYADLVMRETKGEISLDGRRLGFIYRNLLANRSIELAKASQFSQNNGGYKLPSFVESAKYVVQASIPIGLNDESVNREEAYHKMEICFDLLSNYFDEDSDIARTNLVYELFTTRDLMRKAEILLKEDMGDLVESKAWNDLMESGGDITILAYVALLVEAKRPGTIPSEVIEALSRKIHPQNLSTRCIKELRDESIEFIEEIEALLERETDLERVIAYNRVRELALGNDISPSRIKDTETKIKNDLNRFNQVMSD